jgi:signal transduction histidine kinase
MRSTWPVPWLPWWIVDGALAALLALAGLIFGAYDRTDASLTLLLVILPLALRQWRPLLVLVIVAAGVVLTRGSVVWVDVIAIALASFTLGYLAMNRFLAITEVLAVATAMAVGFLVQVPDPLLSISLPFVILVPSWVVGDGLRGWRERAAAQRTEIKRREREEEARVQASVAEERRRVARELHDVVSHGVSVMVVQAGAARQVLRKQPAEAEEALRAVESTGRDAMAELRSLLDVLGSETEGPGLEPQPGIPQISTLVESVRNAGLPARLEVEGEGRTVPIPADLAVYRIVQEALTNALRHAQRASTIVRLVWEPEQLRVEVLDDGPVTETDGGAGSGQGYGLAGMRERATLVGGRLEAGPRLGGGFAVRLWLPLEGAST